MEESDKDFIDSMKWAWQDRENLERHTCYDEKRLKDLDYSMRKAWQEYKYAKEVADKIFSFE